MRLYTPSSNKRWYRYAIAAQIPLAQPCRKRTHGLHTPTLGRTVPAAPPKKYVAYETCL